MQSGRIYIYTKDVMQLTGKGLRTSQSLVSKIKKFYGKPRYRHITVREFADYMNIRVEDILMLV